ncbi:hypothetical protein QJS10_CPB20g00109 [Acorus calamus]|uniref:Uncharacterized protein n=1 Tax=Acorus calamus TaxID=4465 RepID=A0AAV9C863_ACOCL|nr:hypothetical protein QJS10_CPB20g00109 [Acorus calamus]
MGALGRWMVVTLMLDQVRVGISCANREYSHVSCRVQGVPYVVMGAEEGETQKLVEVKREMKPAQPD